MTELETKLADENAGLRVEIKELENELKRWRKSAKSPEWAALMAETLMKFVRAKNAAIDAANGGDGEFADRFYADANGIIDEWNHKYDLLTRLDAEKANARRDTPA